ncbi:DUF2793 domain-containing protein [Microvirga pudoricolor]|uniref:DUF2793 domain-containing protein n=1 Tax=Microvirga pudoricolor TaxID=2778729 RepID=UPI00194DDE5D|nr:DUF2793 domain-containing protein [Microvirga pudoricolor]MBM6592366.1 DUF2793 domain-containing protein [Microvirga pudoricolor]
MTNTPHLDLPLLAAAQAQKHVTHNEALATLDALVHLAVIERNRAAPPAAPAEGARYLVGGEATGAFAGHPGEVAFFDLGIWRFLVPRAGWHAYVEAEDCVIVFDGADWQDLGHYGRDLDNLDRLGIGTVADDVNRLAAKLNAALFTARAAGEGGTGNLRISLNKSETANVVSQLYQRAYSGRAETGLIGGDDFSIRVSADGSLWRDALAIDRNTGIVSFPSGLAGLAGLPGPNLLHNAAFLVNQRGFPGGSLAVGYYGFDRWRAGTGNATLSRAADGTATLTGTIEQVLDVDLTASLLGAAHYGGQTYTLSVENPTSALTVSLGGASGVIPAGSGRRSATLTLGPGETGSVTFRLQAASACAFRRLKLEPGGAATPWAGIALDTEEARCRRYYQRLPFTGTTTGTLGVLAQRVSANMIEAPILLPVAMRTGAVLTATYFGWTAGAPSGSQMAFLDSATSSWISIAGTPSASLAGTPGTHAAILRVQASGSFGGAAGAHGTLHLGGGAAIALQAEP